MTSSPEFLAIAAQGPLDARGRLVHEDDGAAQLALALAHLEAALAEAGLAPSDLVELRVRTTDTAALTDVYDVLTERLDTTGARPEITVTEVGRLAVPGMFVTLEGLATRPPSTPAGTPTTTPIHTRGGTMTLDHRLARAGALRGLCGGRVHLPGDPAYDTARLPWNVAVDQRPAAVAIPHDADEVAAVVRAAAAAGLRVAPQSTGHNAGPLGSEALDDVVLLRLSEMTGVSVDPVNRTARVVGGTLWQDVVAAAGAHGLAALHGSSPDVAVAGYTLGGGLSFYSRQHGLATNTLTAVELVRADGTLVRADATHHADLFWAVRGGGGNFGVVTALELRLFPLSDVYGGMLLWDRERAPEIVRAWVAWTRSLPETVTTSLRVMSLPPLPELPPFLSGRQLVVIDGAVLESDERAAELLAPLRALAPEIDTFARMPATELPTVHMDPPGPTPAVSGHALVEELPEQAIEAFLAEVGPGRTTPLLFAELRQLGGALSRPTGDAGALSHLPADYLLYGVAMAPTPEMAAQGRSGARRLTTAMAPWTAEGRALNFTEERVDPGEAFDAPAWARLQRVRAEVDPTGLFRANHQVPVAS